MLSLQEWELSCPCCDTVDAGSDFVKVEGLFGHLGALYVGFPGSGQRKYLLMMAEDEGIVGDWWNLFWKRVWHLTAFCWVEG